MDETRLQDLISRGMGIAARKGGVLCDAFRPCDAGPPLVLRNRFLRLSVAFNAEDPSFRRAGAYGRAAYYAVFDSAYTRPGDYLAERGSRRVWFLAEQLPLLLVLCVLANRVVSLARRDAPARRGGCARPTRGVRGAGPAAPVLAGLNAYGGVNRAMLTPILTEWPASVLAGGGGPGGAGAVELPGDTRLAGFSVLLPAVAAAVPRVDDLLSDDLGRNFIVASAELSPLGGRLVVRQVAS